EQVLEKQTVALGAMHSDTLDTLHRLAWVYGLMGRFEESLALFDKYLTLRKATFGPEDRWGWELGWFVMVCQWAGQLDKADALLREAIAKYREDEGSVSDRVGDRNTQGHRLGWLAVSLLLRGRYDEAEPLAREAIAMVPMGDVKHSYW